MIVKAILAKVLFDKIQELLKNVQSVRLQWNKYCFVVQMRSNKFDTQLHAYNAAYIGSNAVKFAHVRKRNRIDVNWMATETTLREYTRNVLSIGHKFFNQFTVSLI